MNYETTDLALVVTLVTLGQTVIDLQSAGGKRKSFRFMNSEDLQELIRGYHAKELRVEPSDFFYTMRQIKARLYDEA